VGGGNLPKNHSLNPPASMRGDALGYSFWPMTESHPAELFLPMASPPRCAPFHPLVPLFRRERVDSLASPPYLPRRRPMAIVACSSLGCHVSYKITVFLIIPPAPLSRRFFSKGLCRSGTSSGEMENLFESSFRRSDRTTYF